ncbi:MAG TPA: nucleotidyltransferase domain-containing protein [Fimbriimonadaceae bacterium]|nr:nucleotidyltransferase domain-containing protein [Fimbriimonadaceae bacterium]
MTPDPERSVAARETLSRIAEFGGVELGRLLALDLEGQPEAERSLLNFERWLHATSSPALQLENALSGRDALGRLLTLLGASQAVADVLIQNPELAHLVLEPDGREPDTDAIAAEGRTMISGATSYSHALDRIRFLKQRWMLPIVVNDVFESWPQETVWRALSELAGVIIRLGLEVVGANQETDPGSLVVVAFGKLGGGELNYSSDIDLVYVVADGLDEAVERKLAKFAEVLGRALSDRSGRGSLYRVDLRLRPYGAAGPLTQSMAAIEAYYERYAEPWEVQALLRSRVICGSEELTTRWEVLREATCFKAKLGEPALEAMLSMRGRIEENAHEGDLKRGSGGIRDVEFLVQILQLLHGSSTSDLRVRGTLDAIRSLDRHDILNHAVCQNLANGYEFLRRLEHRCQLLGDQQTHELPTDPAALATVARLMGCHDASELHGKLQEHRRTLEALYTGFLQQGEAAVDGGSARSSLSHRLGPAGLAWFDSFALSDEFYDSLAGNGESLERVERILHLAPALVHRFKRSTPLTELLVSGELEEDFRVAKGIDALSLDFPIDRLAEVYTASHTKAVAKWVLSPESDLGVTLTGLADALVRHVCRRLYVAADVLALGSYARHETAPESDLDVVCLVADPASQPAAEAAIQGLLSLLGRLRRMDAPVEVDLRLRPDGGKGLLARSYSALKAYDLEGMELWERFALGQARLVVGSTRAAEVVADAAYGLPLTPERIAELVAMKRRVETERVKPQHKYRDVKLGRGGLGDIEWFVHLHEMRFQTALAVGTVIDMPERIRALGRAALINAVEAEELLEAREHLLRTRIWLGLQGIEGAIVPENPDKLSRLADAMGFDDGNAFLARHESIVSRVREIYEDGLARLRA